MDWEAAKIIAAFVGAAMGLGSLMIAARVALSNSRTNRARFWLDLRKSFSEHQEVHLALRTGGKWTNGGGPEGPEEWAKVDAYMGLFELCEVMLEQKLLDERTFRESYEYRVQNIVANKSIRDEKLTGEEAEWWVRFSALLRRMEIKL